MNKSTRKKKRVRKLMAKEKTVRILYMSGLWLPFHKQTSSYFCVFYLDILFLSLSTVWHLDFKKDWIHRKVLHMIYLEKVEFLLLKFRNVWKVIIDATEMVNAIFSLKKEWKETHQGKKNSGSYNVLGIYYFLLVFWNQF